jgi:hypothetical protein
MRKVRPFTDSVIQTSAEYPFFFGSTALMSLNENLMLRAKEYAHRRVLSLGTELGHGVHGIVFATESQPEEGVPVVESAIKVHEHEPDYCRERDVYFRLKEKAVKTIRGCHVPLLLAYDDELWVIEMTVVSRPFVLDFAGAYLDSAPDFSEEVVAEWLVEKEEQFGSRWSEVQSILRTLQGFGIHVLDVSPSNVSLVD